MKKLVPVISLLFLFSCKKDNVTDDTTQTLLANVKLVLAERMGQHLYAKIDFSKAGLTTIEDSIIMLQIPFEQKLILIKTERKGQHVEGRIIELQASGQLSSMPTYEGRIIVQNLEQQIIREAQIVDGHIRNGSPNAEYVTPDPYQELPEVIIVSTYRSSTFYDYSTWLSMISFFDSGDRYGGYYSPYDYTSQSSGGGGGSGSIYDDSVYDLPMIYVDYETQFGNPAIDVEKYLKCFAAIPNDGAECSIELFTDIPVDGDPTRLFDFTNGSPGHVFIQLKKTRGAQLAVQNFGFYPRQGWKAATNSTPVPAKVVDNAFHEFNASIRTTLTAAQLQNAISDIRSLATAQYDIDQYNCTDFALQIYNNTQPLASRIIIPLIQIPNGVSRGSKTPQGLYLKLEEMKRTGQQSAAITVPKVGWAGKSSGICY